MLLEVQDLHVFYGKIEAIKGISFNVNEGEIVSLIGANGAGKSTFYRLILEPLGLPFVNADRLAKLVYPAAAEEHSYEAALLAKQQRNTLLASGASFCFETVFYRKL